MNSLIELLRAEPALAWKLAVNILGHDQNSTEARQASNVTRHSSLVTSLLSERNANGVPASPPTFQASLPASAHGADGTIPYHPYKKWYGAHWVLSILADLGCPAGDESLRPMLEQPYDWLLSEEHKKHIRVIDRRTRRCASQEGNAVWYSLRLGLADSRTDELAARLMKWQWPDGGWNCDKHPEADTSSFMETLIPLRALALYAQVSGNAQARTAARRAAEVFLTRQLFKRRRDGAVMDPQFVRLHYPCYWHYDILFGLKVMAEAGFISDKRCQPALDLLESKRLPDGGYPAESVYYHTRPADPSGYSPVSYGGTRKSVV